MFEVHAFIYCTIKKFNTRLYNDAAREEASFCKAMPRSNNNDNINNNNNKWSYKYIDINTTNNNINHRNNNKLVKVTTLNR